MITGIIITHLLRSRKLPFWIIWYIQVSLPEHWVIRIDGVGHLLAQAPQTLAGSPSLLLHQNHCSDNGYNKDGRDYATGGKDDDMG